MNSESSAINALVQEFGGGVYPLTDAGINAFFEQGIANLSDEQLGEFEDALLGADTAVPDVPLASALENPEGMAAFLEAEWKTVANMRAEAFIRTLSRELTCRHKLGRVDQELLRAPDFIFATREGVLASAQAKRPQAMEGLAAAVASLVDPRFNTQTEQLLFAFRTVLSWAWEQFALVALLRKVEALPEEELLSRAKVPSVLGRAVIHRLRFDGAVEEKVRGIALTGFGRILADATEPEFVQHPPTQSQG